MPPYRRRNISIARAADHRPPQPRNRFPRPPPEASPARRRRPPLADILCRSPSSPLPTRVIPAQAAARPGAGLNPYPP